LTLRLWSGRAAIDLVRSTPELDVVVMDLFIPGQSGSDTLAMLRAKAHALIAVNVLPRAPPMNEWQRLAATGE
jgi:CheY-like chemotaxis protein